LWTAFVEIQKPSWFEALTMGKLDMLGFGGTFSGTSHSGEFSKMDRTYQYPSEFASNNMGYCGLVFQVLKKAIMDSDSYIKVVN
jgi:hypothetical protein